MQVKFKKLHPNAVIPTKTHDDDFCYDCYAVSEEEVAPNVWKYGLGFALQSDIEPEGLITHAFNFRARSSVWKTGMVLSNCVGTVDEGYTGEISAVFYHVMPNMPRYKVGDKICQFCFECCEKLEFKEVLELQKTSRGAGSYGSTGA